jgi:O-succinylbenzoic acid--CoA ligase
MSETGSGVVYDGLPLTGVEIAFSSDGEILLRTPMTARSYRDGTDVTRSDGFYATGDLGYLGSDGRLVVQGRRKELINSGGEKIFPGPIEERLRALDGVADAVVLGIPDEQLGEALVAVLLPKSPSIQTTLTTAHVKAFVRECYPSWYAPRAVYLASEVPRTTLGKVIKEQVIELLPRLDTLP